MEEEDVLFANFHGVLCVIVEYWDASTRCCLGSLNIDGCNLTNLYPRPSLSLFYSLHPSPLYTLGCAEWLAANEAGMVRSFVAPVCLCLSEFVSVCERALQKQTNRLQLDCCPKGNDFSPLPLLHSPLPATFLSFSGLYPIVSRCLSFGLPVHCSDRTQSRLHFLLSVCVCFRGACLCEAVCSRKCKQMLLYIYMFYFPIYPKNNTI